MTLVTPPLHHQATNDIMEVSLLLLQFLFLLLPPPPPPLTVSIMNCTSLQTEVIPNKTVLQVYTYFISFDREILLLKRWLFEVA